MNSLDIDEHGTATDCELPPIDKAVIDINELMTMLPHRHPMLMVDRMIDVRLGHSATGIKNVSINEDFFNGHFPGHPVMPGVLIVESMAQTAGALVIETLGLTGTGAIVYFMSVDEAKFRKPVVPGDQLRIYMTKDRKRGNVWRFHGVAKVDGTVVADAILTAMIMDPAKLNVHK